MPLLQSYRCHSKQGWESTSISTTTLLILFTLKTKYTLWSLTMIKHHSTKRRKGLSNIKDNSQVPAESKSAAINWGVEIAIVFASNSMCGGGKCRLLREGNSNLWVAHAVALTEDRWEYNTDLRHAKNTNMHYNYKVAHSHISWPIPFTFIYPLAELIYFPNHRFYFHISKSLDAVKFPATVTGDFTSPYNDSHFNILKQHE